MTTVQARIHIKLDFHSHADGGTQKLADLTPTERKSFLNSCHEALHGGKLAEYEALLQTAEFNPTLTLVAGTAHPDFAEIRAKLMTAVSRFNSAELGMIFDEELPAGPHVAHQTTMVVAVPPFTCVQYVYVNGHWIAIYNYDLVVLSNDAPSVGDLTANYRIGLEYEYQG